MTRTLRITATLFAALLLTTGTQVASASQRLAAGALVPNVTPTATLTVSPTQTTAPVGASIDLSGHLTLSDGASLTGHTIHSPPATGASARPSTASRRTCRPTPQPASTSATPRPR